MPKALTFYKFLPLEDPAGEQAHWQAFGLDRSVRGSILVAAEGVNGTLVGTQETLALFAVELRTRFGEIPFKWSSVSPGNEGFHRYKVKLKREIVTMGVPDLDVARNGQHVDRDTWNSLLDDPEVVVVDTRNQYEIDIGTFPGSVSPGTTNFRQFPQWVAENLKPEQKVAMFCTGGIRCEKASAFLVQQGFDEVYQLDGGILRYLEAEGSAQNRWQGECFVFDQRVSVNDKLEQGTFKQCYACRHPLSALDVASEDYEKGVCCPHCVADGQTPARRESFRQRQKQVELAADRGEQHIGRRQGPKRHIAERQKDSG